MATVHLEGRAVAVSDETARCLKANAVIGLLMPLGRPKAKPGRRAEGPRLAQGCAPNSQLSAPWGATCMRCYNRFVRWRRAGVWDQIMDVLTAPASKK